jgi:hypothetical protein
LKAEPYLPHSCFRARDLERIQVGEQQELLHHLTLDRQPIHQNIVTDERRARVPVGLHAHPRGCAVSVAIVRDAAESIAQRRRVGQDRTEGSEDRSPTLERCETQTKVRAAESLSSMLHQRCYRAIA